VVYYERSSFRHLMLLYADLVSDDAQRTRACPERLLTFQLGYDTRPARKSSDA
jgi:hypothetical protein